MPIAITRAVAPSIVRCELTHLERSPIDFELAVLQHDRYERSLETLGFEIVRATSMPDAADSVFVEDTVVVLGELAIITRPGAESRRVETSSMAAALEPYRRLARIESPGTIDGGDVLISDDRIFVGRSSRTNDAAIEQLRRHAEPLGCRVIRIAVEGCLHLKSAVTTVGPGRLLMNRAWVDAADFDGHTIIDVDPGEPYAANVIARDGRLLIASAYPGTRARLDAAGFETIAVDVSELAKAEGALTCCSVLLEG